MEGRYNTEFARLLLANWTGDLPHDVTFAMLERLFSGCCSDCRQEIEKKLRTDAGESEDE